jgi:hypothetical protein
MSHFNWPTKPKKKFGSSPKYKFLCGDLMLLLWSTYIVEKGENFGQTMWDKIED